MQIVIDIPEAVLNRICYTATYPLDMVIVCNAIHEHVKLPKGHGRLIDADALAKDLDYDVELDARCLDDTDLVGRERELRQFDKDCKQNCMWYLSQSPTIIEADKGVGDDSGD